MRRAAYIVCLLALGFMVAACAENAKEVRYKAIEKSVVALQDDNKAMLTKVENVELKTADVDTRLKATEGGLSDLKAENERLRAEVEECKKPAQAAQPEAEPAEMSGAPKIKVVARGAKGVKAATAAVGKLRKLGYEEVTLNKSGGKAIKQSTVYYKPEFKAAAHKIAKSFSGATLKPITWKSAFYIIVAP